MSELEQRLTNELGKLAEQYGQDQKRLAGQCASLAGQVTRLEERGLSAGSGAFRLYSLGSYLAALISSTVPTSSSIKPIYQLWLARIWEKVSRMTFGEVAVFYCDGADEINDLAEFFELFDVPVTLNIQMDQLRLC